MKKNKEISDTPKQKDMRDFAKGRKQFVMERRFPKKTWKKQKTEDELYREACEQAKKEEQEFVDKVAAWMKEEGLDNDVDSPYDIEMQSSYCTAMQLKQGRSSGLRHMRGTNCTGCDFCPSPKNEEPKTTGSYDKKGFYSANDGKYWGRDYI